MQKSDPVSIVLTCDDRYVRHAAAAIASVVANSNRNFCFYIFNCGICEENIKKLILWKLEKAEIKIISMDKVDIFEQFPVASHFSSAIFYRIAIPEIMKDLDRVIYMDSDIIALGDLGKVWDIELGDKYLGVVYSEGNFLSEKDLEKYKKTIGLPYEKRYFYDGFMLMNLEVCRKEQLLLQVISFLQKNKNKNLICPEQDILNHILCNENLLPLEPKYNFTPFSPLVKKKVKVKDIVCIHYSIFKPWCYPRSFLAHFPLKQCRFMVFYYQYAMATPFVKEVNKDVSYVCTLKMLYKCLFQPLERFFRKVRNKIRQRICVI